MDLDLSDKFGVFFFDLGGEWVVKGDLIQRGSVGPLIEQNIGIGRVGDGTPVIVPLHPAKALPWDFLGVEGHHSLVVELEPLPVSPSDDRVVVTSLRCASVDDHSLKPVVAVWQRVFHVVCEAEFVKYHPYVHDLPNHTVTTVLNMVARLVPYRLNLAGYAAKELKDITPSNTTSLEASVLANPKLWQKIGKNKYESAGIGSILLQYSYKDCQFSAMAAELMLAQLNQKETLFEDEAKQLVKVHFLLFRTSRTS